MGCFRSKAGEQECSFVRKLKKQIHRELVRLVGDVATLSTFRVFLSDSLVKGGERLNLMSKAKVTAHPLAR